MRQINWKLLNAALWLEVALSFLLPFQVVDPIRYTVGFPAPFLTIYLVKPGVNPFMSATLNPLSFLINGVLLYLVLGFCVAKYQKARGNRKKEV